MRIVRRILLGAAALVALSVAAVFVTLRVRPELAPYEDLLFPGPADASVDPDALRVTFLGVSTLLFDDGETAFMTDGFFSRPGLLGLRSVHPDREQIRRSLARAGVDSLAAVIPVHSHYDHAMDAPEVARLTGAMLVGSTSAANIGRGAGLPEERIRTVSNGEVLRFGRFTVTLLPSQHVPSFALYPGEIDEPLTPPVPASAFLMGECYSVLIEHDGRTILVQGSAGFVPGALQGRTADVVYLGIALLGRQDDAYRQGYWREVVQAVNPRRIVAIHWDDFLFPLSDGLQPMPRVLDDLEGTMRFLRTRSGEERRELRMPLLWAVANPFAGLPDSVSVSR